MSSFNQLYTQSLEYLRTGLQFYEKTDFFNAAITWQNKAEELKKDTEDLTNLRAAGLALILSTIAYEKLNNSEAYKTWSLAIETLLRGRLNWEDYRKEMREEVQNLNNAINVNTGTSSTVIITGDAALLMKLQNLLGITDYIGPKLGLGGGNEVSSEEEINVGISYYPVDFKIETPQDTAETEIKSRYSNFYIEEEPDDSAFVFTRGYNYADLDTTTEKQPELPEPPKPLPVDVSVVTLPATDSTKTSSNSHGNIFSDSVKLALDTIPEVSSPAYYELPPTAYNSDDSILVNFQEPIDLPITPADSVTFSSLPDSLLQMANIAWKFFENNYNEKTGFVSSVKNYPYSTLWDFGSVLAGYISAHKLGIIDYNVFSKKINIFLNTLKYVPLYNNELFNREYNITSGAMLSAGGKEDGIGSGWSALDIGRFLVWLRILYNWYPEYRQDAEIVFYRLRFDRLIRNSQMYGVFRSGNHENLRQEGRLGYEQYSASGYLAWGISPDSCFYPERAIDTVRIYDREIIFDTRNYPYLTSDPFMLMAFETGFINQLTEKLFNYLYLSQYDRFLETNRVTAIGEDNLDRSPWFNYYNLYYEGSTWSCVSHKGEKIDYLRSFSVKAAIGMGLYFQDEYGEIIFNKARQQYDPEKGFYAGIYENGELNASVNVNTNGVILESLLFLAHGRKPFLNLINIFPGIEVSQQKL